MLPEDPPRALSLSSSCGIKYIAKMDMTLIMLLRLIARGRSNIALRGNLRLHVGQLGVET